MNNSAYLDLLTEVACVVNKQIGDENFICGFYPVLNSLEYETVITVGDKIRIGRIEIQNNLERHKIVNLMRSRAKNALLVMRDLIDEDLRKLGESNGKFSSGNTRKGRESGDTEQEH